MIRSYKFLISCHQMLHHHILAFFDRIEFETGEFEDDFFEPDFLEIVNRHPTILRKRCQDIFEQIRHWSQPERSALCQEIRDSNRIEDICKGRCVPTKIDNTATGVHKDIRELFLGLYKQVLDGNGFNEKYGTKLRAHFDAFCKLNKEITLCPICGISELKKHEDVSRDQYDHYLPESLYPYSSVNFENLVLCCKECNSFDAKGAQDTVAVSTGTFFFPYDQDHKGVRLELSVIKDDGDVENIDWGINFSNQEGHENEIRSWRDLYKIDSRYLGYIKVRIEKWYKHYWSSLNDPCLQHLSTEDKKTSHMVFLEHDESLGLSFIRKPALEGFLEGSVLAQAALEAKAYS